MAHPYRFDTNKTRLPFAFEIREAPQLPTQKFVCWYFRTNIWLKQWSWWMKFLRLLQWNCLVTQLQSAQSRKDKSWAHLCGFRLPGSGAQHKLERARASWHGYLSHQAIRSVFQTLSLSQFLWVLLRVELLDSSGAEAAMCGRKPENHETYRWNAGMDEPWWMDAISRNAFLGGKVGGLWPAAEGDRLYDRCGAGWGNEDVFRSHNGMGWNLDQGANSVWSV